MTRRAERAAALLARGAWIDAVGPAGTYRLRIGSDRRSRPTLSLDEAEFRILIQHPGLRARPGGGWAARTVPTAAPAPPAGRPGVVEGLRNLIEPDGRMVPRRANLGESPIAWLARPRDVSGRPWLSPAEVAAGDRLRADAEIAQSGPSLTMRWDALPGNGARSGGGTAARTEPGDRALAASRRVAAALDACGRSRAFVQEICIAGRSIQLAEQALGLRRRQGKIALKAGLKALAAHYGIG